MKKEFIMIDLTSGGHAIIRIDSIEDIHDEHDDNDAFEKSIIICKSEIGSSVFRSTLQTQEIYAMIMTEST